MPDKITKDERRLIDEAIAAGRVTICPPMTYSMPTDKGLDIRDVYRAKAENWKRGQRLRKADGEPPPETAEEAQARAEAAANLQAARKLDAERRAAERRQRATAAAKARRAATTTANAAKRAEVRAERERVIAETLKAGGTQMQAAIKLKAAPMTISRIVKKMREDGKL